MDFNFGKHYQFLTKPSIKGDRCTISVKFRTRDGWHTIYDIIQYQDKLKPLTVWGFSVQHIPEYEKDFLSTKIFDYEIIMFRGEVSFLEYKTSDDSLNASFYYENKKLQNESIMLFIKEADFNDLHESQKDLLDTIGLMSIEESCFLFRSRIFVAGLKFEKGAEKPFTTYLQGQRVDSYNELIKPNYNNLFTRTKNIKHLLENCPDQIKSRISLAFSWAINSQEDLKLNVFLKQWFAIELLIGTNGKNTVLTLVRTLSSAYSFTQDEIRKELKIGEIFGLRSKIVHNGFSPEIIEPILMLVWGIFVDLANFYLTNPTESTAMKIASYYNEEINAFFLNNKAK